MEFYVLAILVLFVLGMFTLRFIVSKPEERIDFRKADLLRFAGILGSVYILVQVFL